MFDPSQSSFALLDRLARAAPDRAVLFSQGEALCLAGLLALVERASSHLAAAGIGRDDRVAVLSQSRVEILFILLAAARIGAVVLLLDPDRSPDAAEAAICVGGASLLIHDSAQNSLAVKLGNRVRVFPIGALRSRPAGPIPIRVDVLPGDPWLILQNTDAALDHAALARRAAEMAQTCRLSAKDGVWLALPLTGLPGLAGALAGLGCGGRVVLSAPPPLSDSPQVTVVIGGPDSFAALLQAGEAAPGLPELRIALCIGRPLPGALPADFAQRFGVTLQDHVLCTYPASANA